MNNYFIFDVESVGLHGEAFAVAGGVYNPQGVCLCEFAHHCDISQAVGTDADREWVSKNVTVHPSSLQWSTPQEVRNAFWYHWLDAKTAFNATMFVECGWPVEAAFIEACIADDPETRNWQGPYPMHEIASVMLAAGMDPMASYPRTPEELPAHEPLADSRQSARLLFQAFELLRKPNEHIPN